MARILIVEDDKDVSSVVCQSLALEGHSVHAIGSGDEAEQHLLSKQYDLLILDWQLPRVSGLEILQHLRERGDNTRVLMLTGKDHVNDRACGLDSGADDYLIKPFNMAEVTARVKVLLRRGGTRDDGVLRIGKLTLNSLSLKVTSAGEDVRLAPREFALLEFLMRHPNENHSAESLLSSVWKDEDDVTVETVRTCIKRVRKKLGDNDVAAMLQTSPGCGYSLRTP